MPSTVGSNSHAASTNISYSRSSTASSVKSQSNLSIKTGRVRMRTQNAKWERVLMDLNLNTGILNVTSLDPTLSPLILLKLLPSCAHKTTSLSESSIPLATLIIHCSQATQPILIRHRLDDKIDQWKLALETAIQNRATIEAAKHQQLTGLRNTHLMTSSASSPSSSPSAAFVLSSFSSLPQLLPACKPPKHQQHPFSYHNVVKALSRISEEDTFSPHSSDANSDPECELENPQHQPNSHTEQSIQLYLQQNVAIKILHAELDETKSLNSRLLTKLDVAMDEVGFLRAVVDQMKRKECELTGKIELMDRQLNREGLGVEEHRQPTNQIVQLGQQMEDLQTSLEEGFEREQLLKSELELEIKKGRDLHAFWKNEVEQMQKATRSMVPNEELQDKIEEVEKDREQEILEVHQKNQDLTKRNEDWATRFSDLEASHIALKAAYKALSAGTPDTHPHESLSKHTIMNAPQPTRSVKNGRDKPSYFNLDLILDPDVSVLLWDDSSFLDGDVGNRNAVEFDSDSDVSDLLDGHKFSFDVREQRV
ncbi:UNVERIFIED_CONTAM: hypothetical protein HDU68_010854 [Siphonaria sp. JEL0065]|nr:hypothetical protein HDU68_010854 [Siphonaria sp. JEL0065]